MPNYYTPLKLKYQPLNLKKIIFLPRFAKRGKKYAAATVKRQIERLTLPAQPTVTVLRGKTEQSVAPSAVQKGDLLVLSSGNAVCADCVLQQGQLEVNEAILTGESEPVFKKPGDRLLSGSSVIAGRF